MPWRILLGQTERPEIAHHIENIAVPPELPADTALIFRREGNGRACRRRAVLGELTGDVRSQIPPCFAPLLTHLKRPTLMMMD